MEPSKGIQHSWNSCANSLGLVLRLIIIIIIKTRRRGRGGSYELHLDYNGQVKQVDLNSFYNACVRTKLWQNYGGREEGSVIVLFRQSFVHPQLKLISNSSLHTKT